MAELTLAKAAEKRERLRDRGTQVVFTNGCFDILHEGHLHLLGEAKNQGDYLVVGLNSDDSVNRLKGDSRPVMDETARSKILNAVEYVDDTVVFDEETPKTLIETLSPDVLVKGSDYEIDEIVGAEHVQSEGGTVYRVELIPGKSTTDIIESIRSSG